MLVDFVVRLSVTVEREAQKTESTHIIKYGGVAQLGEHLLCKQGVRGSIPLISTMVVWRSESDRKLSRRPVAQVARAHA